MYYIIEKSLCKIKARVVFTRSISLVNDSGFGVSCTGFPIACEQALRAKKKEKKGRRASLQAGALCGNARVAKPRVTASGAL